MTDTTDTAAPEFNFDAFMYGVRRAAPFDGSTLADSIADDEVRSIEAAFNSALERAEAAEARVKELEALKGDQVPVAWIRERIIDKPEHKGKVWRDISYPAQPEPAAVDGVYHDVIIPLYDRPQKLTDLPYDVLFNAIGKAVNIQGEALSISVKAFKAAIEAAGGVTSDHSGGGDDKVGE